MRRAGPAAAGRPTGTGRRRRADRGSMMSATSASDCSSSGPLSQVPAALTSTSRWPWSITDGIDQRPRNAGVAQVARQDERRAGHARRPFVQPIGTATGEHDIGAGGVQRARHPGTSPDDEPVTSATRPSRRGADTCLVPAALTAEPRTRG